MNLLCLGVIFSIGEKKLRIVDLGIFEETRNQIKPHAQATGKKFC